MGSFENATINEGLKMKDRRWVLWVLFLAGIVVISFGGSGGGDSGKDPADEMPVITSLTADPAAVATGQSSLP